MPQRKPKQPSVACPKRRLHDCDSRVDRAWMTCAFRVCRSLGHGTDTDRVKAVPSSRWGRPNPVMLQPNWSHVLGEPTFE